MEKKTLMERLLQAGYPEDEIFHHESDLYIYYTSLTKRIVTNWCKENGYSYYIMCQVFKDQVTGRPMFDIPFQYMPWWENRRNGRKEKEDV